MKQIQKLLALVLISLMGTSAWALKQNADGAYVIKNAADLYAFAKLVNAGTYDANAIVTADIDYTTYGTDGNALIGGNDWTNAYVGTFDAQQHKITIATNLDRDACNRGEGMGGLFGRMNNGAVVKNLWLDGTLKGNGHRMSGLCQNAQGVTIQNVLVSVDIESTWAGQDSDLAAGGIMGQAEGTNLLKNVIFAGSFSVTGGGKNGGQSEWFGGIAGWVENGLTTMENVAAIIHDIKVDDASFTVGSLEHAPLTRHDRNLVSQTNCYYVLPSSCTMGQQFIDWCLYDHDADCTANASTSTEMSTSQLLSGELCYKMNENAGGSPVFTQDIDIDNYVIPFPAHDKVYLTDGNYTNYNGCYYIDSAQKLKLFAQRVNAGAYDLNAVLTADIDYTAYGTDGNALIGGNDWTNAYVGTFDGQGHKITIATNLDRDACNRGEGMGGLFGRLNNGCVIKDLWLTGTLKGNGHRMSGLCQNAQGVTIQNVLVSVDIESTWAGQDSDLAAGGIMGQAEGTNLLKNVVFAGSFSVTGGGKNGGQSEWFGGIAGWVENGLTTMQNVAAIINDIKVDEASFTVGSLEHAPLTRHDRNLVAQTNCYYVLPDGCAMGQQFIDWCTYDHDADCTASASTCKEMSSDQVKNGELTYALNGESSEDVAFWQSIGSDKYPVPMSEGHAVVYNHDGNFSNADEDGFYEIGTADQLYAFAKAVNAGDYSRSAKISADIDYTAYGTDGNALIGGNDWTNAYTGTFDAQGHKITIATNLDRDNCNRGEGMGGLFGRMNNGAVIKNLWLDGTLKGNGHRMSGLCQNAQGVTIQNVLVSVDIESTWAGQDSDLAAGGIMGQAEGTNLLKNVVFAGSFSVTGGGKNGGQSEWFGGIAGWVENGLTTMENVAAIINDIQVDDASFTVGSLEHAPLTRHDRNLVAQTNCYYVLPTGCSIGQQFIDWCLYDHDADCTANASTSTQLKPEQVASGELCYKLNGDQSEINFWQLIGDNDYPVPYEVENGQVYQKDGVYTNSDADLIRTADDLYAFAKAVNAGDYTRNAKVTADIDYTAYGTDGNALIGGNDWTNAYMGTFDAQGHKITIATNLDRDNCNRGEGMGGLFGRMNNGAIVKNLWLDGTLKGNGHRMSGLCQNAQGVTIQNVVVTVDISSTWAGQDGDLAAGGIMGQAEGTNLLKNVIYCGSLSCTGGKNGGQSEWFGGIAGWVENGLTTMENVAAIITDIKVDDASFTVGSLEHAPLTRHDRNLVSQTNCYYMLPEGCAMGQQFIDWCTYDHDADCTANANTSTQLTADQVKSGELCFLLNGNQNEINFYQTIGSDKCPVNTNKGHKQVYGKGDISCSGALKGNNSFSNDAPNEMDPHDFVDGVCTVCGTRSTDTKISLDEDGYYDIADKYQMQKVYDVVNNGEKDANIRLIADIDMSGDEYKKSYFSSFAGTFDGQYHTLTINIESASASLFGALTGTVKNLTIKGKLVNKGERSGVISALPGNCTIENVEVGVEMHSQYSGTNGNVNMGGFVGYITYGYAVNLTNCAFTGHIIQDSFTKADGTTDYYDFRGIAGLVAGINGEDGPSKANIRNCLVAGEQPSYYGESHPTSGNSGGGTLANEKNGTFVGHLDYSGTVNASNNYSTYYCSTDLDQNQYGTVADNSALTSGEICYKLNNGGYDEPVWREKVGLDAYPVPNANNVGIVYQLRSGAYVGVYDDATMAVAANQIVPEETAYLNGVAAAAVTKAQYEQAIADVAAATTFAEFKVAYKAIKTAQLDIEAAARNYETYKALAAEALAYLEENDLQGDNADMLRSYLEDNDEPSEDFPNGTYQYVIEEMQLNNQGILDEKDFLNDLFRKAIGQGYQVGSDISMLLTNADFSNGWSGWNGKAGSGSANLATPIVETWRTTSESTQTLTGLKEGVYEIDLSGLSRAAGNNFSRFYSAFLTANGLQVPIMNLQEDAILFSQAQDKVNCYVAEDGILNDEAYYANSYTGASYAFGGGRYVNRLVVNVGSDGTLKLGFNEQGTGYDYDWMCVGNAKLIYRGSMDEASESVALTLEGMVARANTILNAEFSVDPSTDVTPNFYSEYRTQLQTAVDEAAGVSGAADQYAMVQKLSTLFGNVYKCQKAYLNALEQIITYSDKYANALMAGVINQDEYKAYQDKVDEVSAQYQEGSMTTAQANSVKFAEPTAINDIMADVESGNTAIYNLAGQKLQKMQKGINIVGGKKIFVK